MSTHTYSLKWEISQSAATCTITATRISFGELCCACGQPCDGDSVLSYSALRKFPSYIPTRDGVPSFRQGELGWMISTSLALLRALQRGVNESGINPFFIIAQLVDNQEEWTWSETDNTIYVAALEKLPAENLLTVEGR